MTFIPNIEQIGISSEPTDRARSVRLGFFIVLIKAPELILSGIISAGHALIAGFFHALFLLTEPFMTIASVIMMSAFGLLSDDKSEITSEMKLLKRFQKSK